MSTVVTTRRLLERLAVHYVSRRMAWKLLKDIPKSAMRKATRGMPSLVILLIDKIKCTKNMRTFASNHSIMVRRSWDQIYRWFSNLTKNEDTDKVDRAHQFPLLAKKVSVTTPKYGASLVFASIGAGVGATLFHPSIGQWIGIKLTNLSLVWLNILWMNKFSLGSVKKPN
ncbi:hypothetical protein BVC80_9045g58 [Macleaya cordata]|uniref:Uncharacterized protein n=1 Tax=Macleaya cordata TaxID=56857 RepID=A0A200R397_MACCD|nr:hypothetical protein BVC80_9045g58 [Macleaya cordata]